mmetsp:Transcript_9737/g.14681  ORF Transcript_9737/g.14681 Transcript_9737/m.14681 type:complete len:104 (+) Transcript_9737:51-362(+)
MSSDPPLGKVKTRTLDEVAEQRGVKTKDLYGNYEQFEYSPKKAWCCWCIGFIGLCGCHRCYLNMPVSGTIYALTLGVFGFGQIFDACSMDDLLDEANGECHVE